MSSHNPVQRVIVLCRNRRQVMLFSAAVVFLLVLGGPRVVAVLCNNRGSVLLDRALLSDPTTAATSDLIAAGRQFQAALRYHPRYVLPYYNLGAIYARWGDIPASAEAYARGVELGPRDVLTRFQLGLVQAALGDEAAALASWQRVGAAAFFANRAKAFLKTEDIEAAILDARRALELDPANPNAYYALVDIYVAQEDYEAALQVYWTAPDRIESYYRAGNLLRRLQRAPEAVAVLQDVLAQKPDHVGARIELGRAYLDVKSCDQMQHWLAPLLSGEGGHTREAQAYVLLGCCLLTQDDPQAALVYFDTARAVHKGSVEAYWYMAQTYEVLGQRDAAIEMYQRVLQLSPGHKSAARALEALGATEP